MRSLLLGVLEHINQFHQDLIDLKFNGFKDFTRDFQIKWRAFRQQSDFEPTADEQLLSKKFASIF